MTATLHSIDYLVIAVYLLALIAIGLSVRGQKGVKEDLFLGGKNLSWPAIGFSLFSTNVSPMMLIGFAGLAYSSGIVAANFEWMAWPFLMLLAMVFIPHYLSNNISTMPAFLNVRFGKGSHAFLSYYSLVSILVIWLGCSLYAGGLIISQVFAVQLWVAIVVTAVIATSYTALGGLAAVVRTDVFQSVIIIVGSVVLTYMAFRKIGNIENLVNGVPGDFWTLFKSADSKDYPWYAIVLGYPVIAVFYWCTDQTIVQKTLAAKNITEGQKASVFTAF
ncbi:MAG: hypothetical protein HC896_02385 [Bacteroidales bacterium]|nr:hypothetical protein [Bacteroidales bacterium]